jgi:hypothetical protein
MMLTIPKVEESKKTVKLCDGCVRNKYRVLVIYTLHSCRISLREREHIFKKIGFPDQEIAMNFFKYVDLPLQELIFGRGYRVIQLTCRKTWESSK